MEETGLLDKAGLGIKEVASPDEMASGTCSTLRIWTFETTSHTRATMVQKRQKQVVTVKNQEVV